MNKKVIVMVILGSLFLVSFTSLSALEIKTKGRNYTNLHESKISTSTHENTWYVDDDNTDGPWIGSKENPFQHITDAVENASNGDTLFVYSGTYFEKIKLDKHLNLKGVDTGEGKPVVDGNKSGVIFRVIADGCIIDGFEIRRAGYNFSVYGSNIYVSAKNTTIINNDIFGYSCYGVRLYYAHSSRIINNTIKRIGYMGIYNQFSDYVNISYNYVDNPYGSGIMLDESFNNVVYKNIITACDEGLLYYFGGGHKTIENCISNNTEWGMIIYMNYYPNEVIKNTICFNKGRSLFLNTNYKKILVKGNTIHSNYVDGIEVAVSNNVKIFDNNIYSNRGYGIKLLNSNELEIKGNNIENNTKCGVIKLTGNNVLIYNNNFINNDKNAQDIGSGFCKWDDGTVVGGNYWSDYTGEDKNKDGIGDSPYYIRFPDRADKYPFMNTYGWLNSPPNKPIITGPTKGKVGEEHKYVFSATDTNDDEVWYWIEWGDNTVEKWIGPYKSGEEVELSHVWSKTGNYVIKAKAKDISNVESDWATLEISMPKNRFIKHPVFSRFLDEILLLLIQSKITTF